MDVDGGLPENKRDISSKKRGVSTGFLEGIWYGKYETMGMFVDKASA